MLFFSLDIPPEWLTGFWRVKRETSWLLWFVWFIWLNQTNRINQRNQMNQTNQNEGARSEYPWMNTTTLRYTSSLFVRRERTKQDLRDRRDARR